MAFEKRDPIPPGIYWLDVPKKTASDFSAWVRQYGGGYADMGDGKRQFFEGRLKVIRTEGNWKLFRVMAPVPRWDARIAGFPTIAPRGAATTKRDTVKREDPESIEDYWGGKAQDALSSAGGAIATFGVLWLLSSMSNRR